jgi:uncharacterized repeat protein (TIGR03843 family)
MRGACLVLFAESQLIHGDIYVLGLMATEDKLARLENGTLRVTGRLIDASNASLYAIAELDDVEMVCIYKPIAGERPLWDFPDGCLAHREFAAYIVSEHLGFHVVPLTVLRDGPYGKGMAQEWIDIDESIDLAQFFSSDHSALRSMALFDAVVNNTDRKIGHLLPVNDDIVYGCDHGVTFHVEDKLRTVLWQWAGESLRDDEIQLLQRAVNSLNGELRVRLEQLLTEDEIDALEMRVNRLLNQGCFPHPSPDWPAVPWPAF